MGQPYGGYQVLTPMSLQVTSGQQPALPRFEAIAVNRDMQIQGTTGMNVGMQYASAEDMPISVPPQVQLTPTALFPPATTT